MFMNQRFYPIKILFFIILISGVFRFYGLNWDQGFHLHPDERAITMYSLTLSFPNSFTEFFSVNSPLNPHFFAYGSFPLYLLKGAGVLGGFFDSSFSQYANINILGRYISALFDISTIILIYFLGKRVLNKQVGLLSAFFYSISVLPIQSSHFYIVDIPLTFFTLLTLYILICFYEKPTLQKAILIGFTFGLSIATKTSASLLTVSIGTALFADFLLIFFRSPHKPKNWLPHLPKVLKKLFVFGLLISCTATVVFFAAEPYALISFPEFFKQTLQQRIMTYNPFIFPYTLQYVGKIPYLYEVKNLFLWGQGPFLSLFSIMGAFYFTFLAFKRSREEKWAKETILAVFFWVYFLVVGKFAIGFMRYLLPIYPLLCLFAAMLFFQLIQFLTKRFKPPMLSVIYLLFFILFLVWPISFLQVYTKPNTRTSATNWINKNIPLGKSIAIEHWDDTLPLLGQQNYYMITLELYNQDTPLKWMGINQQISQADYIIIASNRLYAPLQKLTDCANLPPSSCYRQTAKYYQDLFSGRLNFEKVAEFASYPTIPIVNIPINDQEADESFTVYDHPKVMIFKRHK
ncbi:phospholipid carrier-dependent glycosyltransferase [Candidatus Parcubacteria bacterium]|nr:MAG: phospholipid carrier-dependent glycosyltransferase [Candidatus Parcubacteria bacterium]